MDLTPYIDKLRRELAIAANAGGDDAQALAERLTSPLESATRLVLLEALSAAASDITRELAPGSVDVRLRGSDPDFIVTSPSPAMPSDTTSLTQSEEPPQPPAFDMDDGNTSRITLRLPEHLKVRVEETAKGKGLSVNAWLIQAISSGLNAPTDRNREAELGSSRGGQRYLGWVR